MQYHPFKDDCKNVITDYEVEKLRELTECINDICNDLGIKVHEFAELLLKHASRNDALNAYVKILEYASKNTDCYVFDDWFFHKMTFEPEDNNFGAFGCRLKIDPEPYLNRIIERLKVKE